MIFEGNIQQLKFYLKHLKRDRGIIARRIEEIGPGQYRIDIQGVDTASFNLLSGRIRRNSNMLITFEYLLILFRLCRYQRLEFQHKFTTYERGTKKHPGEDTDSKN